MATIKSFTDLQQSKKLAEILPLESADMGWNVFVDKTTRILPIDDWDLVKNGSGNVKFYHAWSLAALLGAVDFITINLFYIDERGYWVVSATIHNSTKLCTKYESAIAFNPVDACYELIIKLHEQNLL